MSILQLYMKVKNGVVVIKVKSVTIDEAASDSGGIYGLGGIDGEIHKIIISVTIVIKY